MADGDLEPVRMRDQPVHRVATVAGTRDPLLRWIDVRQFDHGIEHGVQIGHDLTGPVLRDLVDKRLAEAAYAATKAAISAWAESMQVDLRDTDVKVHVVYPGIIDTELFHLPDNDPLPVTGVEALPVDAIVEPRETRRALVEALAIAPAGRGAHGNIPL